MAARKKSQEQKRGFEIARKLLLCGMHATQMFPGRGSVLLGDSCTANSART